MLDLVSSAVCIIFDRVMRDPINIDGLSYLGMAGGFLGMLAAQSHPSRASVPFPEVMALLRVAQAAQSAQRLAEDEPAGG